MMPSGSISHVQQRRPGARVREHLADPRQPRFAAAAVERPTRHPLAQHHFDDAPFQQREHPHRTEEQNRERNTDDQYRQTRRQ
jgi:hypothetical protein